MNFPGGNPAAGQTKESKTKMIALKEKPYDLGLQTVFFSVRGVAELAVTALITVTAWWLLGFIVSSLWMAFLIALSLFAVAVAVVVASTVIEMMRSDWDGK